MPRSAADLIAGWKLEYDTLRRKITSFCKPDCPPLASLNLMASRIRQMEKTLAEYEILIERFSRPAPALVPPLVPSLVIVETDEAARQAIRRAADSARGADLSIARGPPATRAAHSRRARGGSDRHLRVDNRCRVRL